MAASASWTKLEPKSRGARSAPAAAVPPHFKNCRRVIAMIAVLPSDQLISRRFEHQREETVELPVPIVVVGEIDRTGAVGEIGGERRLLRVGEERGHAAHREDR